MAGPGAEPALYEKLSLLFTDGKMYFIYTSRQKSKVNTKS